MSMPGIHFKLTALYCRWWEILKIQNPEQLASYAGQYHHHTLEKVTVVWSHITRKTPPFSRFHYGGNICQIRSPMLESLCISMQSNKKN